MKLSKDNILNGTLIEFKEYSDFEKEAGRGKVINFEFNKEKIEIKTDGNAELFYNLKDDGYKKLLVLYKNGVFYFRTTDGYFRICYALCTTSTPIDFPFKTKISSYDKGFKNIIEFNK